jgi:hypothetical protein
MTAAPKSSRPCRGAIKNDGTQEVDYHPKYEMLWVRIRKLKGYDVGYEMAGDEKVVQVDREHPERVGQTIPSFSKLDVTAFYDTMGLLVGIEILGLPNRRPK